MSRYSAAVFACRSLRATGCVWPIAIKRSVHPAANRVWPASTRPAKSSSVMSHSCNARMSGSPGCSASASVFGETWFSSQCPSARERSVICLAAAVVPCPPRAHGRQQSRSEKAQSGRCPIVCPTSSLSAPTAIATAHRGQLRAQDDDRGGRVARMQVQFMQRCKHDKCFTHTVFVR